MKSVQKSLPVGRQGFTLIRTPLRENLVNVRGFTLIELLVVVGILAVLLAIVLIAINPARQFAQANNTKRRSDANALLNAIHQYGADNKGVFPAGIPQAPNPALNISDTGANICTLIMPQYISALPSDPQVNNGAEITDCAAVGGYNTGYTVVQDAGRRITVAAPSAEIGEVVSVTR